MPRKVFCHTCACLVLLRSLAAQNNCSCSFCGNHEKASAFVDGRSIELDESFPGRDSIPGVSGPFPVVGDAHVRTNASLLVLLAGVGDARCAGTIANVFTRAQYPERMRVGIVDQNRPSDSGYDCVATYCAVMEQRGFTKCPYLDQIETLRIDAGEARGPAWARAAGAQFVRTNEHDFCLQADAHTDFLQGFDVVLPNMWAQTGNEYAILSTYVNAVAGQLTKDGAWSSTANYEVPILCGVGGGYLHRNTIASAANCLSRPLLQRTMGAGLTFSKCHFEARVPNDPFLTGIFDGEEFSRNVRAWTHGYDVYAPQRAVVFHDYNNPHFHTGSWSAHDGETYGDDRIQLLMSGKPESLATEELVKNPRQDMGIYGLGKARTLAQFEEFSGIRVRANQEANDQQQCASLKYVAYANEPGTVLAAPPPPLNTAIPRTVVKGSERSAWPDTAVLSESFKQDAQEFVLTEIASVAPGFRGVPLVTMLAELGVEPPPTRSSYSTSSKSSLISIHHTLASIDSSVQSARFLRGMSQRSTNVDHDHVRS